MATLPALMTVEQFQELPLDRGPVMHELHHGEVVTLTRPKAKHYRLQKRLERLLETRAGDLGVVGIEMPFRAVPQFDLCLANGCEDFWIVDEKARTITAIAPDGKAVKYSGTDCIPLPLFGGDGLRVADVFK